jgi:mono/diheme cytochrome c family protein
MPVLSVSFSALYETVGRLHVVMVHFPIALLLLAGVIEAARLARFKKGPSPTAATFLTLGAIAAVVSVAMGWILKGEDALEGTLAIHFWVGLATAVVAIVAAALGPVALRKPEITGLYRAWAFAVAILVGVTGHYGGVQRYGDTYLTELLFPEKTTEEETADSADAVPLTPVSADRKIDFARDVQPILQSTCYECHGENKKKGGLRLDARAFVMKGGATGPAIVPGDAGKSLLLHYVLGTHGKKRMPLNKDPLKPAQIAVLTAWVDQGATWPDALANEKAANETHWAFVAPDCPDLPAVKDASWPKNPIDTFVLARLEKEGLKPSPEASKETLIRRASLDLVGLPPTLKEVDDFLADASPDAYEKVVDRLLASPHYGERWGRHWLDIARYADTNGYEKDNPRVVWPYRDWVINAINRDLPYDQFVIEQIAGDMLPNATPDQRIATGFHRNTMFNEEGGIDVEEFRYKALVDRVQTTSTAFMGLTLHCAQCHDHKYDPLSHKDYFSFFALLNNADEPKMDVPDPDVTARREKTMADIRQVIAGYEEKFPTHKPSVTYDVLKPAKAVSASGATLSPQADGSVLVSGTNSETDTYTLEFPVASLKGVTELKVEALTHRMLPKTGPGRSPKNGNFVLSEIRAVAFPAGTATSKPADGKVLTLADATADHSQDGFAAAMAVDGNPATGWAISKPGKYNVNRTLVARVKDVPAGDAPVTLVVTLDQQYPKHAIGRFRLSLGRAHEIPKSDLPIAQQRKNFFEAELAAWEADLAGKVTRWTVLDPAKYARAHEGTITELPDKSLLFTGDNYYRETYRLQYPLPAAGAVTAIRVDVIPDDRLENGGPGRGKTGGFLLSEFAATLEPAAAQLADASGEVAVPTSQPAAVPVAIAAAVANAGSGIENAIDGRKDTHWIDFAATGQLRTAVFRLKDKLDPPAGAALAVSILQNYHQDENLGRVRISVTADPRPDLEASGLPMEIEEILLTPKADRSEAQRLQLKEYYLSVTPHLAAEHAKVAQLKASMPKYVTTLVMQDRPVTRSTRLHHRGEFLEPKGDPLPPGVPAIVPPLPAGQKPDRLTLARWLVNPDLNPLIGRVTANRVWNTYFGRGIVNTVEDFGTMGEKPSHPELLDWLATELPRQGWSMKKMHRLIVTSATYRQSSTVTPDHLKRDPENVLLTRGPRLRVEAEIVRDIALASAGLLSPKIGGPSVFPPQPEGVAELSYGPLAWKPSAGEDRYRRGLYTFLKRTSPYPGLITFDAPTSETTCVRRVRSNTPLQALTTLNDEVFVEAAQHMARRVMTDVPTADTRARAEHAFRLCLTRKPTPEELTPIVAFYDAQLARFKGKAADAAKVAAVDPAKPPEGLDPSELAAWTAVSRAILNLDETVTKE